MRTLTNKYDSQGRAVLAAPWIAAGSSEQSADFDVPNSLTLIVGRNRALPPRGLMRVFCFIALVALFGCSKAVSHLEIRAVLARQVAAWNCGDIEGFMEGYWKSDQMLFTSPTSTTKGWRATLERYRQRYPSIREMGRLKFDDLVVRPTNRDAADVTGRYRLDTQGGIKTGRFELTFRRIDGAWVITGDHTIPDE